VKNSRAFGNDESALYSPTGTAAKRILVVGAFEFELK
jgi:hypothetical protein